MPATLHHNPPLVQSLPWAEPLALAAGIKDDHWVLLYSGAQAGYSGRYSYLAWNLAERIEGKDFSALSKTLSRTGERFFPAWFGYLGYELKHDLEKLSPEAAGGPPLPRLCMMRFHAVCEFDHKEKTLTLYSDLPHAALPTPATPPSAQAKAASVHSNMTKADYLKKAATIIEHIHAGDLYQANLTRKFSGALDTRPDAFAMFNELCRVSPAPYSVFMRLGESAILSSSPERFLTLDVDGGITARPIKGTAARTADDKAARAALAESPKDRAENLMIVDLMRNDLARCCEPGSVTVDALYEITTHPTIHHMSSTISGTKRPECSALDVVKACFPPGSMTGAPKIRAMELCSEMEGVARGVYSGAIGWFGGDGSCDLSVVIRTLLLHRDRFEFQVGGGIVADSTPENEWRETLEKARAIAAVLGLADAQLEAL